ncbi:MAG: PAS domain-containing protein [Hyphomicrobiaceae bacterium]
MSTALLSYVPVCDAVAQLLWPHAEVVLHDLKSGTIAYIANSYSKRRVGDSSLNEAEPAFDLADDVIGPYPKTNWDGRRLKSITSVLRDGRGRPIGLLCINHDIEAFAGALEQLTGLIALPEKREQSAALFAKDWRESINTVVGNLLKERNASPSGLTGEDVDLLITRLDKAGMFEIRKAVPYIAEVLKLSRATIYNRLATVRERAAKPT